MYVIAGLTALEILDSRGRPTLEVTCRLTDGATATAQVPSGASTGRAEAVELRDNDPSRYAGMGCLRAAENVSHEIAQALTGVPLADQGRLDEHLRQLDGTDNKSRLGGNAVLAVSLSFARAVARSRGIELYELFAEMASHKPATIPRLTVNLFSGGKHAGGQVPIQDILIVPALNNDTRRSLEIVSDVYRAAAELSHERYGMRLLTADEGGLAPPFTSIEEMFDDACRAIERAGYRPGQDVCLAIDVAASHFYVEGMYAVQSPSISGEQMVSLIDDWVARYPVVSVEDGLAEEDWAHWPQLRQRLAGRAIVVGDDLLCTQPTRVQTAVDRQACDALLLKVNQVGTLTEAYQSLQIARSSGWQVTISARSGETEDHWLADLAVGWSGDQIKVGSITQSERLAKYNRLLKIESQTQLPVVQWPRP